jgi:hypothetical protein
MPMWSIGDDICHWRHIAGGVRSAIKHVFSISRARLSDEHERVELGSMTDVITGWLHRHLPDAPAPD